MKIVIKLGTNVLKKDVKKLIKAISRQVSVLMKEGHKVIIVTSGAIGFGIDRLKLAKNLRDISLRQVAAAVGQSMLMEAYKQAFDRHGIPVAQLLLTYESFTDRKTYLNLSNSLAHLLKLGVVPIINENDPISVNEIDASFGDNDKLSALVASKIEADLLLLLTDTDGLYDNNPKNNPDARLIKKVDNISQEIEKMAGKASLGGVGGMRSKISAAKTATQAGVTTIIAHGWAKDIAVRLVNKESIGTIFFPQGKLSQKKGWIKFSPAKGVIEVDEGAMLALKKGKNLLPIGITAVHGQFRRGDIVELKHQSIFAKAIIDFSSSDVQHMMGKIGFSNVAKRANLVLV